MRLGVMIDRIAHRGPDDQGQEWTRSGQGWIGLGNRRLAVLDRSAAGHQPMARSGHILSYNGEVYNTAALRAELTSSGNTFSSGTDTEVVLAVLSSQGPDGLSRLNGMFALAWWDSANAELILARDRFGIKPLYYCQTGRELLFASEIKSLLAAGIRADVDVTSLPSYLAFGWVPGSATMIRGVSELLPGHLLRWKEGRMRVERFRDAVPAGDDQLDFPSAALELRSRLGNAVSRQLVADVPVGVLLSGGLDSTAIAALAVRESRRPVAAYTIAFRPHDAVNEQNSNDARFAGMVADHLDLDLRRIEISADIAERLEDVSWHLDDPVADPASILTLLIAEEARKDVTVLLSGQGADELFGGYRVHAYHKVADALARQPGAVQSAESSLLGCLPRFAAHTPDRLHPGLLLAAHRAGTMVLENLNLSPEARYVAYRSAPYFLHGGLDGLLTGAARAASGWPDPAATHHRAFTTHPQLGFFDRMLYVDLQTFLLSQNLAYSDRLSMAASIELRVPFLDDAVADFAFQLPEKFKLKGLRGKAVLRSAVADVVPRAVLRRRKAGFGAPIRSWLRAELRPLVEEALSPSWLAETGFFDAQQVRQLIDQHVAGTVDNTYRIWTLLTFSLWWHTHCRGVSAAA
jgi:asparagine synthase (glutamine-hydrolysing)